MSDRIRALGALLLAAFVAACNTPSVPIPPPEPEKMSFDVDFTAGSAQFSYQADSSYESAIVYVFNRDKGAGVITTAQPDGSVLPTDAFAADEGDDVVITFEVETQLASTCVELHQGASSSEYECMP